MNHSLIHKIHIGYLMRTISGPIEPEMRKIYRSMEGLIGTPMESNKTSHLVIERSFHGHYLQSAWLYYKPISHREVRLIGYEVLETSEQLRTLQLSCPNLRKTIYNTKYHSNDIVTLIRQHIDLIHKWG